MKKIYLLIFLLLTGLCARPQKIPSWKIKEVVNYFQQKNDSIYVINFWATFCVPCVAEMPYLQAITQQYQSKKVKLLLVSLDLANSYPSKIKVFAKRNHINSSLVWLNETDADYFCNVIDKNWGGSIPATLIVNTKTGYRKFYEQEFEPAEFEAALIMAINN
jgi:thiol-disulfide isomerase/thioredoxin